MCRAVPQIIMEINGDQGLVEIAGVRQWVDLTLVQESDDVPRPGDYVLVHAGFAISILDEEAASETLQLIRELIQASEENTQGEMAEEKGTNDYDRR